MPRAKSISPLAFQSGKDRHEGELGRSMDRETWEAERSSLLGKLERREKEIARLRRLLKKHAPGYTFVCLHVCFIYF